MREVAQHSGRVGRSQVIELEKLWMDESIIEVRIISELCSFTLRYSRTLSASYGLRQWNLGEIINRTTCPDPPSVHRLSLLEYSLTTEQFDYSRATVLAHRIVQSNYANELYNMYIASISDSISPSVHHADRHAQVNG